MVSLPKSRVEFTHPDKILFPAVGVTKAELINYYASVAEHILPYLTDRPHSLHRFPEGLGGESFYQKDVDHTPPRWVKNTTIYNKSDNKPVHYLVCENLDDLLYMAQIGCIEMNPWNSRAGQLGRPDWCVLDLDPVGVDFNQVVKVANEIYKLCQELSVQAQPKTSGQKGIHIYIPLESKYGYLPARQFAKTLAELTHQRLPGLTSLDRSPAKRRSRVYLDWLQNAKGQTLASPYSVRPTARATVSAPLNWSELKNGIDPEEFTLKNMPKRLSAVGDLWRPVMGKGVDIKKVLAKL